MALALFSQSAIQDFIKLIESSLKTRNRLTAFSYTAADVENIESALVNPKNGTTNVIESRNNNTTKWEVKALRNDDAATYSVGDNAPVAGRIVKIYECNVGRNTFTKSFSTPGHNLDVAYKKQIADMVGLGTQAAQDHLVPRMNYEYVRAQTRGAADVLFQDTFKSGNPLIAGTAGVNRTNINVGIVNGDAVTMIPKPLPTTVINDAAWNTTVAGALAAAIPTLAPTFQSVLRMKALAVGRIKEIKGQKFDYVLDCTASQAQSIISSILNFQTQTSLRPEEIQLFGWDCFIISRILVCGSRDMDWAYISDGTGAAFTATSTNIDFGNTIANNFGIDIMDSPDAPTLLRPMILSGAGAVMNLTDWNMRLIENEGIQYREITGREFVMTTDIGFTRADFVALPRHDGVTGISGGLPTYQNMKNQSSIMFLSVAPY